MSAVDTSPQFDKFARGYDDALNRGLSLTGDDKEYFARGRIHRLARHLAELDDSPASVLDFGCGTGSSTPHFFDVLGAEQVVGVDVSAESLAAAESAHGNVNTRFLRAAEWIAAEEFDLAFTNGVFHHIPSPDRAAALAKIHAALLPGGLFAFWENNPWNLGTRLVMRRIAFDRDAVLIWPHHARELLRAAGFEILLTEFAFIFPRFLRVLRPLEHRFRKLALGGQYLVLARKADAA